jgi:hypothetical protein
MLHASLIDRIGRDRGVRPSLRLLSDAVRILRSSVLRFRLFHLFLRGGDSRIGRSLVRFFNLAVVNMLSSLLTYTFVVPSQDSVMIVDSSAWADARPITVSSGHSTISIRVMTPASQ